MTSPFDDFVEFGVQPLDRILRELGLDNHDLVESSSEQLTHKMVAKGRKGRRISYKIQQKILSALNASQDSAIFALKDLFTYDGG